MTREKIEESVKFNAREISQIIDDAEWVRQNGSSDYDRESAKSIAYEKIIELIKGE